MATVPVRRRTGDHPPTPADGTGTARTRLQFLTGGQVEPDQVREAVLASWWRSREFHVPADRMDVPYRPDQDLDTPLIRSAEPVLRRLGDQLDGQPLSMILTDPKGVVLTQRTCDRDLHRHLEGVHLVPGFSYGERFVGTNGIGSAIETGTPMHVFGHEHYAENLEDLACAGVPIHHPISGKAIGAIDLTCWRRDAGGLLVALARTTAEQIRQALLTSSNVRELALFQSYLRACRRTNGIVIAFNDDIVTMNDNARQLLHHDDQAVMLSAASEALAGSERASFTVTLPAGNKVRMHCRKVTGEDLDETVGALLYVSLIESDDDNADGGSSPRLPLWLPGLVGSEPLWQRCCHEVDAGRAGGEWLALAGEPGVGKHMLARAVHQRRAPAGRLRVVDAARAGGDDWLAELRRDLVDDPVDTLVLRHVDQVPTDSVAALVALLTEASGDARGSAPWVVVTLLSDAEAAPSVAGLMALFPRTVRVPPLRRRSGDLAELVPLLLSRFAHGGQLTCSPAAMHLLMRASWPGNVEQLHDVLRDVARRRRAGTIQTSDLPAAYRTVTRRSLNRLELIERDAIVNSLEEAAGNKVKAAKLLGISRATLYRKIHDYRIVART